MERVMRNHKQRQVVAYMIVRVRARWHCNAEAAQPDHGDVTH